MTQHPLARVRSAVVVGLLLLACAAGAQTFAPEGAYGNVGVKSVFTARVRDGARPQRQAQLADHVFLHAGGHPTGPRGGLRRHVPAGRGIGRDHGFRSMFGDHSILYSVKESTWLPF